MDFFADGGFQQLFCDLNDQQTFVIWDKPLNTSYYTTTTTTTTTRSYDPPYHIAQEAAEVQQDHCHLYFDHDYYTPAVSKESRNLLNINEQQLQTSLDYLLTSTSDSLEDYESNSRFTPLTMLAQDLSDWEEKFLDNYIEIPELVDILPEKTPLCTDTCNHFLQESAKNLKLYPSPPSSPVPGVAISSSPGKQTSESAKENDKTYPCDFGDCRKIYAKPAHLKAHLRRHLGEKPYICNWPDCTWRFSRSDELSRHRRSHSGVKPYKCDFCAKCFARSDHLTKHRKVHERRLQAARKAGKAINGVVPQSVLTVRPGRKRKNQF